MTCNKVHKYKNGYLEILYETFQNIRLRINEKDYWGIYRRTQNEGKKKNSKDINHKTVLLNMTGLSRVENFLHTIRDISIVV